MDTVTTADPKTVAHLYYDILNTQATDRVSEVFAENLVGHGGAGANLEEFTSNWKGFLASFPDLVADITSLVCEGDTVSVWLTYRGTHDGDFAGVPASGRRVKFGGWDLMRIGDGRIVEFTQHCDVFAILNQIGALPTAGPA